MVSIRYPVSMKRAELGEERRRNALLAAGWRTTLIGRRKSRTCARTNQDAGDNPLLCLR